MAKYVQDEITNKGEERQGFKLVESTPITISEGRASAHKLVYTFLKEDEPRSGETNKIQRIYTIEGDKAYSLAYLAEIDKYDDSLPLVEKMVDSFRLSDSESGSSTTQVQSSDRNSEDNNGSENCDPSYPEVCIRSPPPDLNCPDISYKNFRVTGSDPHGFDRDKDGIGCELTEGGGVTPPDNGDGAPPERECDPSYPDVCIKSPPPDLNCPDIPDKNFRVTGSDPHGFDRDNDGIGCESSVGEDTPTPSPSPQLEPPTDEPVPPTDELTPPVCRSTEILYKGQCLIDDYDCEDASDFEDPRCCDEADEAQDPRCASKEQPTEPTLFGSPTLTPTPTPTPPVDPSLLSQLQPQCEFGVNPRTGLCNTEDIPTATLTPSQEPSSPAQEPPTPTPDEEVSTEEEPEEEAPEDESQEETEGESEGNGESSAGSTFE